MSDPLAIDISPHCSIRPDDWARLAAVGHPWLCGILKAGQGTHDTGTWVREHAEAVRAARLTLGYYWYLRLDRPGAEQADALADLIDESPCTMWPVVDVEEGGGDGRPSNDALVAQRGAGLVDTITRAFVRRIDERLGLPTILYAGGWLRSLRLRSMLGCEYLWISAATRTLPRAWYEHDLGCPLARLFGWQYAVQPGTGMIAELAGYPHTTPIGDSCDITEIVMPGGLEAVAVVERPAPSVCADGPGR